MPTSLLILEPPKNNKAEAPRDFIYIFKRDFYAFLFKNSFNFYALLTHVVVRLQWLYFLLQTPSLPRGKGAQVSRDR